MWQAGQDLLLRSACRDIDLMAFLPHGDIGGGSRERHLGLDRSADRPRVRAGRPLNGNGVRGRIEPDASRYISATCRRSTVDSTWRDIKVFADHAFIVSEAADHGMQVFDLTQLRDVTSPPVTFTETAHYAGFGSTHTLAMNSRTGFAYAVGTRTCDGGLHVGRRTRADGAARRRLLQPRRLHPRNAVRRLRRARQRRIATGKSASTPTKTR